MAEPKLTPRAKSRYGVLETDRNQYLSRARDAALVTVPYLMPPEGFTGASQLAKPYQSLGSRLVRNLASKLMLSLMPANSPFFAYDIDELALAALSKDQAKRGEVDKALSARVRAVMGSIKRAQFRIVAFEALRQLILAGNYLIHVPKKGKVRGWRLNSYVVRRDPTGDLLEIVVKETKAKNTLPAEITATVKPVDDPKTPVNESHDKVDLYTHIERIEDGSWTIYQEIDGKIVTGTEGAYPKDKMPWMALRLTAMEGEDYGRGYCEEFIGDLNTIEALSRNIVDYTEISTKVLILVDPNGVTNVRLVSKAKNGDVLSGREADITSMKIDKAADLQIAMKQLEEVSTRLSFAFLLNSAVQRKGERVTAEEIRYMAQELDDSLGGIHTTLSAEFLAVLVPLFEARMEGEIKAPPLPKDVVSPTIVTGLEALGRGHDLQNLKGFLSDLSVFGPEVVGRYVNMTELITRFAAANDIETGGLIRTDDEIEAAEQQAQMQAMAQNLGPDAIKAMGGMAQTQMNGDAKVTAEQVKTNVKGQQ